ncbi:MAG: M20/M25/M40 family metallo-hydrolase [Patescibacteria group bacterium]|nr:M20/M25/M40 family metallo-hydrolase [Patescibacteria group bacterium]
MNTAKEMLASCIAIQSVSADPSREQDVAAAAHYLADTLEKRGFTVHSYGKPDVPKLVVARYTVPGATRTIGIYGHYDVQPEDPVAEWNTPPFELVEKNGKLYGRGVADNKGHIIQNITAVSRLIESGSLSSNIVFLLEGEEETGSVHLDDLLREAAGDLKAVDVFYVTDMGMHAPNVPQIFYALRGLVYFELELWIGSRDLHSGVYGNAVPNPANVLANLIGRMKDVRTGEILIPGVMEGVRIPDDEERALLAKAAIPDAGLAAEAGVIAVSGVGDVPAYLAPKILPSLDVNGMVSGFTGEGSKTIIPRSARAKFSIRLVEYQNPEAVRDAVESFVEENLPEGVNHTLTVHSMSTPFFSDFRHPEVQRAARILGEYFGTETVFNRSGGSIPAAESLERIFGKPSILTGFTLPDDNIHAPNENFDLEMFEKGIEALVRLYGE